MVRITYVFLFGVLSVMIGCFGGNRSKIEVSKPIPQTKYFNFVEDTTLVFSQKKKVFLREAWVDGKNVLLLRVLDSDMDSSHKYRLLGEIYSEGEKELQTQFLLTLRLSSEMLEMDREIVYQSASTGPRVNVGAEGNFRIARQPFLPGGYSDGFTVHSLKSSVSTSTGTFRDCLEIRSFTEHLTFAPYAGLVRWRLFDQEWIRSGVRDHRFSFKKVSISTGGTLGVLNFPLSPRDRAMIEEVLKDFCKLYSLKFDSLLTVGIHPKKRHAARCRFLVYREDKGQRYSKRYDVEERVLLREVFGDQVQWGMVEY